MVQPIPLKLIKLSRRLRRSQTPWEAKLWSSLRAKKLFPIKFKRQFAIGPYIVDFCSPLRKIIIELDGGHHNTEPIKTHDQARQKYLEQKGYKILRFWNLDIDNNIEGVLETVQQSIKN